MPDITLKTWRNLTQLKLKFEEDSQSPLHKEIKKWFSKVQIYAENQVVSSSST